MRDLESSRERVDHHQSGHDGSARHHLSSEAQSHMGERSSHQTGHRHSGDHLPHLSITDHHHSGSHHRAAQHHTETSHHREAQHHTESSHHRDAQHHHAESSHHHYGDRSHSQHHDRGHHQYYQNHEAQPYHKHSHSHIAQPYGHHESGHLHGGASAPSNTGFAERLLHRIGAPVTHENLRFLNAWQRAEGGSADNPFNTTQHAHGARNFNSVGVKRYGSIETGIEATARTLENGYYGSILHALRRGTSAHEAAVAVSRTPWGTGGGVARLV